MIERLIENWLTKAGERDKYNFTVPFSHLLAGEGYRVVHLSRHGEMEQGKDLLAIDPEGKPCAFQLKCESTGKITQKKWGEFKPQIDRLIELPIKHPSICEGVKHRACLVTNGELDEPVRLEIIDRNKEWDRRNYPVLEVTVKGEILTRIKALQTNFWPTEPTDVKSLLELFLADGTACLPKEKLANFLYSILPFEMEKCNKSECNRALASAAIFTAYALSPYQSKCNHVAEIEGWVIYIASLLSLAEKHQLATKYWEDSLLVATSAIEQAFQNLSTSLIAKLRQVS